MPVSPKRRRGGPPNKRRGIGGIPLSLAVACAEKSSPIMFFNPAAHAKGRRFPPDVCAARKRRGGFCALQNRRARASGASQNGGAAEPTAPLFFNLRFGSRFSERSAYLEIGNTTVPPRPYAAAYAGEETAVSSVRPKDTYRASLTCFIVRSSKWPIFFLQAPLVDRPESVRAG